MVTTRTTLCGIGSLLLIAAVSSCGDSSNPAAPSAAPVTVEVPTALVPDGVVSLKSDPPVLRSPINNTETLDLTPVLETANSQLRLVSSANFTYEFEVYEVQNDGTLTRVRNPKGVAQTPNTTSHTISGVLEQATTYRWRARAELGDEKGPWSDLAIFRTPTLLGVPTPVSPINDVTTGTTQPAFVVQNGDVRADSGTVTYQFQLDASSFFPNPSMFSTPRLVGSLTTARIGHALATDTMFYWRVRATDGTLTSNWSATQSFRTPDELRTPDPPPGQDLPLPNQAALIRQLAAANPGALANSCIEEGGSWEFMDLAVAALRATDTRWGYNCKKGVCHDISIDVVDYFYGIGDGQNSTQVYIIDIIIAVCPGGSQGPGWEDQTQVTKDQGFVGKWIFPRPPE